MSQGIPTLLGALAYPLNQAAMATCRVGPYENGSDLWVVCCENPDQTTGPNLVAYKSTDAGVTYVRIIDGPLVTNQGNGLSSPFAYVSRGSSTKIHVGYQDVGLNLFSVTFDMATELFGTPSDTGVSAVTAALKNLAIAELGSGKLVLVYGQSALPLFGITSTAGVWGSPVRLDDADADAWYFDNVCLNSAGNLVVLYGEGDGGAFRLDDELWLIFNGTAVTSRGSTPLVANKCSGLFCAPFYDSNSDKLIFPYVGIVQVGFNSLPAVQLLVGTPSTGPTFTIVTIKIYSITEVAAFGDVVDWLNVVGDAAGTHFTAYWFVQTAASTYTVQTSTSGSVSGPWSAPVLYYSELANAPVGAYQIGLAPIYVSILSDDTIQVMVGIVRTTPGFFRGILYYWGPGEPPPVTGATITAVQDITGGSGTPTTVTATGPSTASGMGGFGPSAVAVGSFVLSQVLVPGFTAGPWVLSGTGGTLVGSTLTVADGDDVTVTINNTFNSGELTVTCVRSKFVVGQPYNQSFVVTGGVPPYHFVVIGTLPTGLTMDPDTGQVTGTPTDGTAFSFVIQVTDSA